MASKALVTFSSIWCWFTGLCIFLRVRFWRASTSAISFVPSHKSVVRSATDSPSGRRCSFTQFLNVCAWISIHTSSFPLICIPLAAWPSGLLANRPTWQHQKWQKWVMWKGKLDFCLNCRWYVFYNVIKISHLCNIQIIFYTFTQGHFQFKTWYYW